MPACSLLLVAALAFALHGGASAGTPPATTERIASYIRTSAARYGIPDRLISAIIWVESRFDPRAVSPRGARGLMQLMPGTAAVLGVRDPFDPGENIDAGVRHLRGLMDRLDDSVPLALAAYNAGEGAVRQHRGVPPFPETQEYVSTILRLAAESGTALPPLLPAPSAAPRPVLGPQLARVVPPVPAPPPVAPEAPPVRPAPSPPPPGRVEAPAPVRTASAVPPRPARVDNPAPQPARSAPAVPPRPSRVEAPPPEPVRSVSAAPSRPARVEVPAPAPALPAATGGESRPGRIEPAETPRVPGPVQPARPGDGLAPASLPALDDEADRPALPAGTYRVVAGGATLYTNIPPAGRH